MEKLKLILGSLSSTELLTREQLKKIVGGSGSGGGWQKCCPKGNCNSAVCSTCVEIPEGSHADCSANPNAQVCDC